MACHVNMISVNSSSISADVVVVHAYKGDVANHPEDTLPHLHTQTNHIANGSGLYFREMNTVRIERSKVDGKFTYLL